MITVCLSTKDGHDAVHHCGHGGELEEALADARQKFQAAENGSPAWWTVCALGKTLTRRFTNYQAILTTTKTSFRF